MVEIPACTTKSNKVHFQPVNSDRFATEEVFGYGIHRSRHPVSLNNHCELQVIPSIYPRFFPPAPGGQTIKRIEPSIDHASLADLVRRQTPDRHCLDAGYHVLVRDA